MDRIGFNAASSVKSFHAGRIVQQEHSVTVWAADGNGPTVATIGRTDELAPLASAIRRATLRFCSVKAESDERLGLAPGSSCDPAARGVRYQAAYRTLFEPFGHACELIDAILKKRESGYERLKVEAEEIGKISGALSGLQSLEELQSDKRLKRCKEACSKVYAILEDFDRGAADRMQKAAAEELCLSPSGESAPYAAEPPPEAPSGDQSPPKPQPLMRKKSEEHRLNLLKDIDDCETSKEAEPLIVQLFQAYGQDNSYGFLEGEVIDKVINDLVTHVRREWDERNERHRKRYGKALMGEVTDEYLKDWCMQSIDPDGDRCITWEEGVVGFKKVVDDIE
jgi:hypothetical protein